MTRLALPTGALATLLACSMPDQLPDTPPADPCAAGAFVDGMLVATARAPDLVRRAFVWIPPTAGPHDVVVDLHEYRSDPIRQQHYSGWLAQARAANAILVAPDGRSATWNAGECCGRAQSTGMRDVEALDALVARVDAVACTTGRVLATGIGNGAMMAHRWACDSDVPDAVVSVGGTLQQPTCAQRRPIPLLHYHGAEDDFVPADGSVGRLPAARPGAGHRPVAHAETLWSARNGADGPHLVDDGALHCRMWHGAAPTAFCTVDGMGDQWPGAADAPVASTARLADATAGAWAWVSATWGPRQR